SLCFCHALFLRSPPPPRPTLFPYTTLFRSRSVRDAQDLHDLGGDTHVIEVTGVRLFGLDVLLGDQDDVLVMGDGLVQRAHGLFPDRKSTRLNSSHDQISYAVFCLKKKKKKK